MTFEEFFAKKRIDLAQLQRAKPDLYEEFRSHYSQMGEKSFDHTKKYWFNRLRKDYLLEEVEPPVVTKTAPDPAPKSDTPMPTTTTAKPTGLSSMSPSGFKPRFKAATTKPAQASDLPGERPAEANASLEETAKKAAPPPTGFKPRFKAGVTPPAKADEEKPADEQKPATNDGEISASNEPSVPDETTEKAAPPAKPMGFKPRFKPGTTGVKKDKPEE
ncbi:hypothetical protein [Parapedobacter sp. DT-150]|uniref:hypothetical protein n=1 Tax=Parapedobacter sp. DT-150 TaxID=3396162 RepID=UPI003F1AB2E1